ncbi:MAG: MFS transporter [Bacteroidaceae bacterium]|nr:MFS transporter [Bacteroidaceae bacterium]
MTQAIQQKLSDNKAARWTALIIASVTMMMAYFFTDVMSPLEDMLATDLHWNGSEYGFFSGAYGLINVFLLMLFFGGIILDKMGIRFTGIMATLLMFVGALIKWYAVTFVDVNAIVEGFNLNLIIIEIQNPHLSNLIAALGFAIYGVGCEIAGITVSKVITKWFTGHELALAMGLQVALARLGTAAALFFALPIAKYWGGISTSIGLGAAMLCIAFLAFIVYCVMDKKLDASCANEEAEKEASEDESFHISDLKAIFTNPGFWAICLLCLMFYGGVFPFLKFATKLMIVKYNVPEDWAGIIPGLLPFGTIILTPVFGGIYDKKGHGVKLMLLGSVLLTLVHVLFALPILGVWWFAIINMIILGVAFSLVPSAMWPSVPKIIPMKLLGSAFAIIFFIQNIGLSLIPMGIGEVNKQNTDAAGVTDYTTTMTIFAVLGIISILLSLILLSLDKKKGYGLESPNVKE